ncbi:hypothetical protein E8E11_006452 [Didymella keratinophila]|nr:hypothetical protein E8E11_006452 [Didymella keratinophila]
MPGLPKNLLSTYQKYKNHTDSIAQWLATTAKARGYISPKSKGSGKSAKAPQGRPTYTILAKEWTPMAEFIAALVNPPVIIPSKLAALLDITILLRQSYSEDVTEILADSPDQDSNDRHAFFLVILKNVRNVLTPLMLAAAAVTKKLKSTCTEDIFNMFEHLELEEPSAAFERAPDATLTLAHIYKAERPNDIEEDFFALHLLLHDLARLRTEFHGFGIAFANAWDSVTSCAHLCNAVNGGKSQDMMWKDLDIVIGLQEPKTLFIGDAPTTPGEYLKRFALAMGASAANLAKSTRKKRGLVHSKKGPKGLKELGGTMQAFRSRIRDVNGPKGIRAEDVQKILDNGSWDYELDDNDNAHQVYKGIGKTPKKAPAKQLSVFKCVGLIRDLLHAVVVEIAFDYFRLHRQCWRLLRAVKDHVRDDLIRIYGPDYVQKESELPFIVGYVLMTASRSQGLGDLLKSKQPGVQITSKVLEGARYVVEGMVDSGAGGLIVEQILPRALELRIDFELEEESQGPSDDLG